VRLSSHAAGEMISLSNVFKPHQYIPVEDTKTIQFAARTFPSNVPVDSVRLSEAELKQAEELEQMKNKVIEDAEAYAEQCIQEATAEAEQLRQRALQDIEAWWEERRAQDEQLSLAAKEEGYEQGFQSGSGEAEEKVRQEYAAMLEEGRSIITQAVQIKQHIIAESEPFLIDLAAGIAEKIIVRQLDLQPEWVLELIRHTLIRRREKGVITLCVSPSQFGFVQNAREELIVSIDSQAELQIIPDASVKDHGCVVRSSFGSIDARIGTQLDEIKAVLRHIAEQEEETDSHE
jgi:flagellar assembly protein FliH